MRVSRPHAPASVAGTDAPVIGEPGPAFIFLLHAAGA